MKIQDVFVKILETLQEKFKQFTKKGRITQNIYYNPVEELIQMQVYQVIKEHNTHRQLEKFRFNTSKNTIHIQNKHAEIDSVRTALECLYITHRYIVYKTYGNIRILYLEK